MTRIGISDVANAAGVSISTVSVVLNNVESARVHPGTRERIWHEANRLGYVPNGLARGLRLQRSDIIGFISDSVATTPYAGNMILGAQEAARASGRLLMAVDTRGDDSIEEAALASLLQMQVDGVLYAAMYHRELTRPQLVAGTPTVLVNATTDDPAISSVVPDEQGGVRMAIAELLENGHRRIGYVGNTEKILATPMRQRAYRAAMRKAGITVPAGWTAAEEPTAQGGYLAALRLLRQEDRPTALFCFKDTMALGVYQAAHELGIRIPDDLSVVGFDNLELIATNAFPGLTTVSLPHYEMGVWATDQLVAQMTDPGTPPKQIKMPGRLHRRESVRPPRTA
jgi:LacI family transcriptional regulator